MKRIVLISCVSKKCSKKCKARDLYISPLFKYNLQYAQTFNPERILILSAKYGVVGLTEEIEPYEQTLNKMPDKEIKLWANSVIKELESVSDLKNDEFIFLAGERYRKYLLPFIAHYQIPLRGLGIGKQLGFLKNNSESGKNCEELHTLFNTLPRIRFPFDEKQIPKNGIYILFEKGQIGHDTDRIVRVGTHTGENQLPSRLIQHFVNENKDRSIFRKNIGRALLNKNKDSFLEKWELDLTTKKAKEEFSPFIDFEKQKAIEKQVTQYIQENFDFVILPIDEKQKRLELESKLISTISLCKKCAPNPGWLGLFSPKEKIRKSGLWLVNELYKNPLSKRELEELKKTIFSSS